MPSSTKCFLVFLIVLLANLVIRPSLALANTDPLSATVSATATVPVTTPTTSDTTAPTNPILISPTDGTITSNSTPVFVWRRSSDNNSNTIYYTLYLNGVSTYLGISNVGNSSSSNYSAIVDGDEIKLTPHVNLPDGSYNWYVTASDLSGNTSHSATWNFVIDSTPPYILITDLDDYHNLNLHSDSPEDFTDLNFDISGPKNVAFTIQTEPFATLILQFYDPSGGLVDQSTWTAPSSGVLYPTQYLIPGKYRVIVSAYDYVLNTVALPEFTLTVTQAAFTVTPPSLPGSSPSPIITIPYSPLSLSSLPATIAQIETRLPLLLIIGSLLALLLLLLLVFLWRRKVNLVLIDLDNNPIQQATVYHSIPTTKHKYSALLLTSRTPHSYALELRDLGKLYIPGLTRYSTLTIRTKSVTTILSISHKSSIYYISLKD